SLLVALPIFSCYHYFNFCCTNLLYSTKRGRFIMSFKKVHKTLIILLSVMLSLVWIYPFVIVLFGSLKTRSEIFTNPLSFPTEPTTKNFPTAYENIDFTQSFLNSVLIMVVSVFLIVIFSAMAADR